MDMEAEDTPQTIEIKKEADEYWVTVVKVSLRRSLLVELRTCYFLEIIIIYLGHFRILPRRNDYMLQW